MIVFEGFRTSFQFDSRSMTSNEGPHLDLDCWSGFTSKIPLPSFISYQNWAFRNVAVKDTQESLGAVEHGHSWEEPSQLYSKQAESDSQSHHQPETKTHLLEAVFSWLWVIFVKRYLLSVFIFILILCEIQRQTSLYIVFLWNKHYKQFSKKNGRQVIISLGIRWQ